MVKFGNIDSLQRDREIEGTTGVDLRISDMIFLTVLAATDANVRWRTGGMKAAQRIRRLENKGASPQELQKEYARVYAETLLIGWRGVVDDAGNELKFTIPLAIEFLTQCDDAIKAIDNFCHDTKNFRNVRLEEDIEAGKNV